MSAQIPQDQANYDRMIKMFSKAKDKKELEQLSMLYILDLAYVRSDIALAIHDVEIEKGWH